MSVEGWKKLLASFLIQCRIVDKEFSGELTINVYKGAVSWIRKSETIK